MMLAELRAWRRLTGSAPAQTLRVPALGMRQWVAIMGHTPGMLRESPPQTLLPEPDLTVLIDPLHFTGLDAVPLAVDRTVPDARVQIPANHRMPPAAPMIGSRQQGAGTGSGHTNVRPASGAFGAQPETSRVALEDARRADVQPARLAIILQRYAGSDTQLSTEAHVSSGRGLVSAGQVIEAAASQRPAAKRKVIYLPARAAASVVMPDTHRAAAEPARWEANIAAMLNRWTKAGAAAPALRTVFEARGAVPGELGRPLQGGLAGMPSPRLPDSALNSGRAAVIPGNKSTGSAEVPASATPFATSAARLARGSVPRELERLLQGGLGGMPSPRLPDSVQNAERAAAMSGDKSTGSADAPALATATSSVPVATSAVRLAQALSAAMPPMVGGSKNLHAAAQPVIESLAHIVEQLTSIEMKFSQAANASAAAAASSEEAPAVQWLEDDDLAGRLQGILRRQAKRRGIDLS